MSKATSVTAPGRLAWSIGEAAALIGASTKFLREEARRGKLTVVRRGRRVFVPSQSLEAYLRTEQQTDDRATVAGV